MYKWTAVWTKPVSIATIPQLINIRAIHIRAPIVCNKRLLGTSNMKYPQKNVPESSPNCWLVMANSLFMVKAAKPMLMRSMKAITNRTKTNGMIRVWILRVALLSTSARGVTGLEAASFAGITSRREMPCMTSPVFSASSIAVSILIRYAAVAVRCSACARSQLRCSGGESCSCALLGQHRRDAEKSQTLPVTGRVVGKASAID